jgi:hypothetical protein
VTNDEIKAIEDRATAASEGGGVVLCDVHTRERHAAGPVHSELAMGEEEAIAAAHRDADFYRAARADVIRLARNLRRATRLVLRMRRHCEESRTVPTDVTDDGNQLLALVRQSIAREDQLLADIEAFLGGKAVDAS